MIFAVVGDDSPVPQGTLLMVGRLNSHEHNSSPSGELGVLLQHGDSKVDLIDHSLSRSMTAVEKLKVFESVVLPITVSVMNRLLGKKIAAKMFGHDVTMFQHGVLLAGDEAGNAYPDVTMPLSMPCVITGIELRQSFGFLMRGFAIVAAKFLLRVKLPKAATSLESSSLDYGSTLKTSKVLHLFCVSAPRNTGARLRAKFRVSPVFLSVATQNAFENGKRLTALLTNKLSAGEWWSGHRLPLLGFNLVRGI